LVLKNVNVINVFSEEIQTADIAICDGVVAGVGQYSGVEEIDLSGFFASPGFIDCHLHLESAMITPREFVFLAAKCGTTTFIVDPHEAANVAGLAGIEYMLEQTEDVPANVYIMLPSCVPASDIDDNGATLAAHDLAHYLHHERVLGLGEVMDYNAVLKGKKEIHDKLALFEGRMIDGHAPGLTPQELSAYALAGIATDHECINFEYALEHVRRGMTALVREGSAAKNLEDIITGIVASNLDTSSFCFCTDDKHVEDIQKDGHIDYCVKKAVSLGLDPIKAIKMATIQAAKTYGLKHLGAIAPGRQADIVILDSLEELNVRQVYHKGVLLPADEKIGIKPARQALKNTIQISSFSAEDLVLPREEGAFPVIKALEGQIVTEELLVEIPGGKFFEPNHVYKKAAVVERHGRTGQIGMGVIAGFSLHGGAIASSVSHDSHNITVIGDNDEDMAVAVNELIRTQGGYTLVENGRVYETLELPIMGLMSDAGYEVVAEKLARMIKKAYAMGLSEKIDPFITLSFLSLSVIPELRITPRGIYSVKENRLIREANPTNRISQVPRYASLAPVCLRQRFDPVHLRSKQ
jgi:adenine deaminase